MGEREGKIQKVAKLQAFKNTKQFIPSQIFIAQRNFNGIELLAEKRIHKFRMKPHSLLNPGSMVREDQSQGSVF